MIDEDAVRAVEATLQPDGTLRPLYTTYGYAQVPQTVLRAFGIPARGVPLGPLLDTPYDTVILLLLDACGWRFVSQWLDHPFVRRFADEGRIARLTTQFPSTTAAHVTTMHTGLPPGESGVFEWLMYEPTLQRAIAPLLFSFAGDKSRDTLNGHMAPRDLFPTSTIYQTLAAHGVASHTFHIGSYAFSPFTKTVCKGATLERYMTLAEGLTSLLERPAAGKRTYCFLYFDQVDLVNHVHGPESAHVRAEIGSMFDTLERALMGNMAALPGRTLLLATADHGHIAVDPATTIYLNQQVPELVPLLREGADGKPLIPAGSARDLFLAVREGMLDEAEGLLRQKLAGRASVQRVADIAAEGWFGPIVGQGLPARAGDLVILPNTGETVWWYEQGRYEMKHRGSHGGLTREEAETQLLALAV